jgi:hypothetical protein
VQEPSLEEGTLEISWRTVLWPQFGAASDMLDNALVACPARQWNQRRWSAPSDHPSTPESAEFWYLTYHALFWTDLYLSGFVEGFAPLAPFTLEQIDPAGELPERPYTKEELRAYLTSTRQKCHTMLVALTDEQAAEQADLVVTAAHLETALAELDEGGRLAQRLLGLRPGEPTPGTAELSPPMPPMASTGFPVSHTGARNVSP